MKNFLKFIAIASFIGASCSEKIALLPSGCYTPKCRTNANCMVPLVRTALFTGSGIASNYFLGSDPLTPILFSISGASFGDVCRKCPTSITLPLTVGGTVAGIFIDRAVASLEASEGAAPGVSVFFAGAAAMTLYLAMKNDSSDKYYDDLGEKCTNRWNSCWKRNIVKLLNKITCGKCCVKNLEALKAGELKKGLEQLEDIEAQVHAKHGKRDIYIELEGRIQKLESIITSLRGAAISTPTKYNAASSSQASSPESLDVEAARSKSTARRAGNPREILLENLKRKHNASDMAGIPLLPLQPQSSAADAASSSDASSRQEMLSERLLR